MGFTQILVYSGRLAGRQHWKVKLSDEQVEAIRVLREESRWSYGRIAKHFNTPRATIQFLCTYRRR